MHYSMASRSSGFSMIEVMVALIITVIGVLGMVALQSKAIPYTQDSVQRNTAIMLTDDLVDIIRSATPQDCTRANTCLKSPGAAFPAAAAACSPTPTALKDQIGCWAAQASNALPGATGSLLTDYFYICRSAQPGDVQVTTTNNVTKPTACGTETITGTEIEIQVAWAVKSQAECMDGSAAGNTCTYRIRTRVQ